MKQILRIAALLTCIAAMVASLGCAKLQSRDEMNKGVQAYKGAKYIDAANHFKKAIEFDPDNKNAQLYLATSYMTQWIPGADSPENNRMYAAAKAEFQKVLDKYPSDNTALASMAFMTYSSAAIGTQEEKQKFLEEAKTWNQKRIEVDPNDTEAYYSLGVIAWSEAFTPIQTARVHLGMKSEDPGPIKDAKVRAELQGQYSKTIDDGVKSLSTALQKDPEYDDAMSYLNLLYRKKADIDDTPDEAHADIAKAEEWFTKAMETKKIKAARPVKQQAS